jgi:outer membrane receptor protein involved in Fe transport
MGFRFTRKDTDASLTGDKRAFYLQASYPLTTTLKATAGIRGDYFRYTDDFALSPRLGISYVFLPGGEVHFSYGVYYQSPETFWLNSHPANRDLRYLRSEHFVFGGGKTLSRNVRAIMEIFTKRCRNYPVDSSNPYLTLANLGGSIVPTFFGSWLLGVGSGFARGIEVSLQRDSPGELSWLVNYSYSRVEFKALDGVLRPGDFDFRHILNAVVSCPISPTLGASLRWRYTGGQPYTPFDLQLSAQRDTSYFDMTKINTLRYPAYHRLDIRLEKKFVFKKWNLDAYIDVQNVYNRKNIYYTFWEDGSPKTVHYLPILPLIGLSAHFPN